MLQFVFNYLLLGVKALLAFLVVVHQTLFWSYIYFIIDLLVSFYQKFREEKDKDLSNASLDKLTYSSKELSIKLEKMSVTQQRYEKERKIKENSLRLLNKLISEGLIREKDLLSLSGTSNYFQLFVYSASLAKLAKSLNLENPHRLYPNFLEKLGFVRMGKNYSFFLINKNRLTDNELKNIKELKRFLLYHFSKIRNQEWKNFLSQVKEMDKKEYSRLIIRDYKEKGYLKYNFLLTETNMNPTNIGFVNNEFIGLGSAANNENINSQILEKTNNDGQIELTKELKIKIRKIIEKLDISLLLEGITKEDKDSIDLKQDIIKSNLGIDKVIDFYKVSIKDLIQELVNIGFKRKRSKKIAIQILETTKTYQKALLELNISI